MAFSIQRASMWKRISAALFDLIMLGIVVVLFALALSWALGYDGYIDTLNAAYEQYGAQYGVDFYMTLSENYALSAVERANLDAAYAALSADEQAVYAYNMMIRLTLLIVSISIFLGYLALEVLVPALFKNGQTLGKKIFSLGVMDYEGVRINGVRLFVRSVLGKYTLETMVPVLIVVMIYFGQLGLTGTVVLLLIVALQLGLTLATWRHTPIHDLLATTIVVDLPSQLIFDSREDMIAYKERQHAQKAAAQLY